MGELPRVRMIVTKKRQVIFDRKKARSGQDAYLAHATAEHLAPASGANHGRLAAAQERADRRPETLR